MTTVKQSPAYRHELKYQIGVPAYLVLRQRLRTVLMPDPYAGPEGTYRINSLYFDNADDKALKEKVDGINRREKFRIRYYNDDLSRLLLEKKQKVNGLCLKTSAPLPPKVYEQLLQGKGMLPQGTDPLIQEFSFKMRSHMLGPRTLVSYLREPYIFPPGNVRITFDRDICTGLAHAGLDMRGVPLVPVVSRGEMLLEVKYDAFLPSVVSDILQLGILRVGAFSKYAACRQYE